MRTIKTLIPSAGVGALLISFLTLLSFFLICTNPAQAVTKSTASDLDLSITELITLTLSSPCGTNSTLTLSITPTSTGNLSACPQILRVDTNTPGYSLYLKASTATLNHTSIAGKTIPPTTNNKTPAQLNINSWGFAVPSAATADNTNPDKQTLASQGYSAFGATYSQRNSTTLSTTPDKYATTPTTDTQLKQLDTGNYNNDTVVSNDRTTIYYASAVDLLSTAGTYTTTITYTAIGQEIPEPVYFLAQDVARRNITTMQDALITNACQYTNWDNTNNGDNNNNTVALIDTRNNQMYTVRKMADGKCWMIDNLKLELGVADADPTLDTITLESNNSNVVVDTAVNLAMVGGMSGGFTISGFLTQDNSSSDSSPNLDAWRQVDPYSGEAYCRGGNDDIYGNPLPISNQTGCGYLYNYYTATAGSSPQASFGTNPHLAGYKAPSSICPANWRLPSGYNSASDLNNDFPFLNARMNNPIATAGSIDDSYYAGWRPTGPFAGVFSGFWYSSFYSQGSDSYLWSSSVSSAINAHSPFFNFTFINPGYGDGGRLYGFAVRCVVGN